MTRSGRGETRGGDDVTLLGWRQMVAGVIPSVVGVVPDFYLLENMFEKRPFRMWSYAKQHLFFNENLFFSFFYIFLFLKFRRKTSIFNIRSLSYNVSLQLDIMQNYWKNM